MFHVQKGENLNYSPNLSKGMKQGMNEAELLRQTDQHTSQASWK